jgi:hypothetical protein
MNKYILSIATLLFSLPSFAEKCSDVLNWDMQRFGKGTFDNPIGLDKNPGHPPKNPGHTFFDLSDKTGFGFMVHLDDKNKDQISDYFITGERDKSGDGIGQFQTYIQLDENCKVQKYTSGWHFVDAKGNVKINNDFEVTAKACQELYPQAVNANQNLLCDSKGLGEFLKQRGSSIRNGNASIVTQVFKTCFERPFAISIPNDKKSYHQAPSGLEIGN